MAGVQYGRQELALARLTFTTADDLLAQTLKLERRLKRNGHRAIATSMANLAADALTQIAAATLAMKGDYFAGLEARGLLAGARKSLGEFIRRLRTASVRAEMDSEFEQRMFAVAEETRALLMALSLAIRGVRIEGSSAPELPSAV